MGLFLKVVPSCHFQHQCAAYAGTSAAKKWTVTRVTGHTNLPYTVCLIFVVTHPGANGSKSNSRFKIYLPFWSLQFETKINNYFWVIRAWMEYANLRSTALKREMTILEFIAFTIVFLRERHFFSITVSSEKGKFKKHLNFEISN